MPQYHRQPARLIIQLPAAAPLSLGSPRSEAQVPHEENPWFPTRATDDMLREHAQLGSSQLTEEIWVRV